MRLAASLTLWGSNSLAMRWPEIVANMLGLACIYVLAARLFNRRVALIALAVAAVTWWSIIFGRVVLREVLAIAAVCAGAVRVLARF